jgi:hypothetical protein
VRLKRWEVVSQPLDRLLLVLPRGREPVRLEWLAASDLAATGRRARWW